MSMLIYNTTPILRLSDMKYPLYFENLRRDNPNVQFGYPINTPTLRNFGYQEVYDTQIPTADVVTEIFPELREDGNYYKRYFSRSYTPEEIESNLNNAKNDVIFNSGYIYQQDLEAAFIYPEDGGRPIKISSGNFTAWNNMKYILDNDIATEVKVKFEDSAIIVMDATQFQDFYIFVNTKYFNLRQNYYQFIESVHAATTIEGIPEIPTQFAD